MPDLAGFQRQFAAALMRPDDEAEPAGMAVYRNTALKAAVDALAANYPVVRRLVGSERFEQVATAYAMQFRPSSPVLAGYGARFASHLAEIGWGRALGFLPDVARIERLRTEAHLASDAPPFDPAATGNDWLAIRAPLHPATRYALFDTAAAPVWALNADTCSPLRAHHGDGLLVTRPFGAVEVGVIGAVEVRMLDEIRGGATIGEAAIAAARTAPGTDVANLFCRLIRSGALASPPMPERTKP
jgi:hypothetical protein